MHNISTGIFRNGVNMFDGKYANPPLKYKRLSLIVRPKDSLKIATSSNDYPVCVKQNNIIRVIEN